MRLYNNNSRLYVGVLLLYYDKYAQSALMQFVELMDMTSPRSEIFIVINNESIQDHVVNLLNSVNLDRKHPVKWMMGDNTIREFTGWQEALNRLDISTHNAIVFANDTFVHHRSFGWWHKKAYSRQIRLIGASHIPEACGKMVDAGKPLSLDQVEIIRWISTSIFAMNRLAIEKLNKRIHPEQQALSEWVPGIANEELFFSNRLDNPMKQHMSRWLFQSGDKDTSWYGATQLTLENASNMKEKAMCILSEKWLAMRMNMSGVQMSDPIVKYPHRLVYAVLRRIIKL
jgi:hypothetical protein